jgi:hypothetical protein
MVLLKPKTSDIRFRGGSMKVSRHLVGFAVITTALFGQSAFSISKEMHAMVRMETHSNAVAKRSSDYVQMEHYEIPLELVEKDIAERANKAFIDAMVFERDGKKYVRWVINPEDTKWHLEVANFLIRNGITPIKKTYFLGYMTASRSYIVVEPKTGTEFSIKMSTNNTGGNWKDKQQTWDDAKQIRMMTDFVNDQVKNQPALRNIVLLDEPMAFGIKDLDQAMVIRSYENLKNSGNRYVPGFSIVHEKMGRQLAAANGIDVLGVPGYWEENYNKPLARALAEFAALTGMVYDSPHSQNFLVELDNKSRPTGKIVLRDFGDTYLSKEYFVAAGREDILKAWDQSNIKEKYIPTSVGILHGNKAPTWLNLKNNYYSKLSYDQWGREFFAAWNKEFQKQTGIRLTAVNPKIQRSGNYVQNPYSTADAAGQEFIELVKSGQQRNELIGRRCSNLF